MDLGGKLRIKKMLGSLNWEHNGVITVVLWKMILVRRANNLKNDRITGLIYINMDYKVILIIEA